MSDIRENIVLRRAVVADSLRLCVFKTHVWLHTYALQGISTDFAEYLHTEFTPDKISETINNPERFTLLAEINDLMVGCAQVVLNSECPGGKIDGPELAVLYVYEHLQDSGIGFRLLTAVERELSEMGYGGFWLTVYIDNPKAIAFYHRQGFTPAGTTWFLLEKEPYENIVMIKELLNKQNPSM